MVDGRCAKLACRRSLHRKLQHGFHGKRIDRQRADGSEKYKKAPDSSQIIIRHTRVTCTKSSSSYYTSHRYKSNTGPNTHTDLFPTYSLLNTYTSNYTSNFIMLASTPAAAKLNSIDHQNEAESPVESAEIVTATTEDPKITELLNSVEQTLVKKTKEKSESVAEPPKNWFQSEESKRSVEEQRMIAESNAKPPPKPKTVPEMSEAIVHVLGKYRLAHHSDTKKWSAKGKFLAQVEKFVAKNEPVRLVLPAFPFKSPNKKTKVLGTLPDAGEEMALAHLQGFASAIADVYKPGANILIVSDGLVYNGKLE